MIDGIYVRKRQNMEYRDIKTKKILKIKFCQFDGTSDHLIIFYPKREGGKLIFGINVTE